MAGIHAALAGSGARLQAVVNIAANQTDYVFNTAKVAGYIPGFTDVVFNISSGVYLSASSTGNYAADVDTSWNANDTVRINAPGLIVGCGGVGGAGAGYNSSGVGVDGSAGAAGGPALRAQRPITFDNTGGTIAAGGGGGGGGANYVVDDGKGASFFSGGGGGGGRSNPSANAAGGAGGALGTFPANPGGAGGAGGTGTVSAPGGGGGVGVTGTAGVGGAGGGWGSAGASGAARGTGDTAPAQNRGPYGGGAAGIAIVGNGNITWINTGTRLGAIT